MSRKSGIDHGYILPFKCTSCQERGQKLIEFKTSFTIGDFMPMLVSILLGKESPNYVFKCQSCELETVIPNNEIEIVKGLKEQADLFHEGNMTQDEYLTIVMKTDSQTIKDMYARSKSWQCPECQTANPATFASCWNCGAECPNPDDLILFEGEEMQLNTSVVFGSSIDVKKS